MCSDFSPFCPTRCHLLPSDFVLHDGTILVISRLQFLPFNCFYHSLGAPSLLISCTITSIERTFPNGERAPPPVTVDHIKTAALRYYPRPFTFHCSSDRCDHWENALFHHRAAPSYGLISKNQTTSELHSLSVEIITGWPNCFIYWGPVR